MRSRVECHSGGVTRSIASSGVHLLCGSGKESQQVDVSRGRPSTVSNEWLERTSDGEVVDVRGRVLSKESGMSWKC